VLYDRGKHELLPKRQWSEGEARESICSIMRDAEDRLSRMAGWPQHPDEDSESSELLSSIYCGVAGVVWGLDYLRRMGYESDFDLAGAASIAAAKMPPEVPELPWFPTSYMFGQLGVLLVKALLFDDTAAGELVQRRIEANLGDTAYELCTGTTGSMLAARFLFEKFGSSIWRELFIHSLDVLWSHWEELAPGIHLWPQRLDDGPVQSFVGAGHGFAGNVAIMLAAGELIDEPRRKELKRRATDTVKALATRANGKANWPPLFRAATVMPVQWCHGAPGIITSFAAMPADDDAELDALLIEGGELVWEAGPLSTIGKGCGICHGAAGNSFALLKLYHRTGDARWLERARILAMCATDQMHVQHKHFGQSWYSLWTGDIGVALVLHACLAEDDRICSLDTW
jgi:lantibiotic modifying enzyme